MALWNCVSRVERLGSLNKAAADMGMAYSKAWRIVKQAEEGLDVALFLRQGAVVLV